MTATAAWLAADPKRAELSLARAVARADSPEEATKITTGRSSAWLERLVWDQEAEGSNPFAPIFLDFKSRRWLRLATGFELSRDGLSDRDWHLGPRSSGTQQLDNLVMTTLCRPCQRRGPYVGTSFQHVGTAL